MLFQGYAASESDTHKTGISDFNFVVAGDFSCNKEAKKTVNNMGAPGTLEKNSNCPEEYDTGSISSSETRQVKSCN